MNPPRQTSRDRKKPGGYGRPDAGNGAAGFHSGSGGIIASVLAAALIAVFYTIHPVLDPDTWFHLRLGQYIREAGELPRVDLFSFTGAGNAWLPSGWLTALIMSWLDGLYPESSLGPILMVTVAVALACGVVLWRGRKRGAMVLSALALMAGLTLAVSRFNPRPDVWSMPCLVLLLFILTQPRAARREETPAEEPPASRWLWLLVPLMILWANLHAGVLAGLPILLSYAAWLAYRWYGSRSGAWLKALLPVAVASVAWLANPYGYGPARLAMRVAEIPDASWVMEWMPFFKSAFPMAWPTYWALAVLALTTGWLLMTRWRKFHPLEILWLGFLFAFMLYQRRQVGVAGLGISLLLARHFAAADLTVVLRTKFLKEAVVLAAAVGLITLQVKGANGNGGGWPRHGRNCAVLPCYTADFLKQFPPPVQMFNSYNLGGYLMNILWPDTEIYIDGRLDAYPEPVWLDMLALEENRLPIDDFMARHGIRTFVVSSADSFGDPLHLASRLAARPDFALVHFDDIAAVFVQRGTDTTDYVDQLSYPSLAPWDLKQMTTILAEPESRDRAVAEMGRLLQQSPASAAVHGLAAYIAWAAGDKVMANQQLAIAQSIQPENRQLRLVQNQLARAQAILNRRN